MWVFGKEWGGRAGLRLSFVPPYSSFLVYSAYLPSVPDLIRMGPFDVNVHDYFTVS